MVRATIGNQLTRRRVGRPVVPRCGQCGQWCQSASFVVYPFAGTGLESCEDASMRYTKITTALVGIAALLFALLTPLQSADAQGVDAAPSGQGLVVVESARTFEETWSALNAALDANPNIRTIATVDHGAAAAGARTWVRQSCRRAAPLASTCRRRCR